MLRVRGEKLQVIIIGSGIIGLTTAKQLLKLGVGVTLIDKHQHPASGTSYQNGGQLSYSHAVSVNHAANFANLGKALLSKRAAIEFSWFEFVRNFKWFSKLYFSKDRGLEKRFFEFAAFSKEEFLKLNKKLDCDLVDDSGTLHLFRKRSSLKSFVKLASEQKGQEYKIVKAKDLAQYDDSIDGRKFKGGVFFPGDQAGDARKFSKELFVNLKTYKNFNFISESEVKEFNCREDIIENIILENGSELRADNYVIAAGADSIELFKKLKTKSPIVPVKGYSSNIDNMKLSTALIDTDRRMVYTDLGGAVRVAGLYDFRGFKGDIKAVRAKVFNNAIANLFKEKIKLDRPLWYGYRGVSKDGYPIIGRSAKFGNLYYNIGHANLGWTLSFGSSKILVEEMLEEANNEFGFLKASRFNI